MRVIVLGGTGMAGHVIVSYLSEKGYNVFYASRNYNNSDEKCRQLVIGDDLSSLNLLLDEINPSIIINCIGVLQKESEEHSGRAILLNAYLPKWLANKYKDTSVKVIHLSTDCVFSGERGNYIEDDTPDGKTIYDRTKALGEINNKKDLTFRMSIIGPDIHDNGTGLFNWFMRQKGTVRGYVNVLWNGITTIELARGIDFAIRQGLTGIYQLVARDAIDKYHLLLLIQDVFKKTDIKIEPYANITSNKVLINTRHDFYFNVLTYKEQILMMRDWIENNKLMYSYQIGGKAFDSPR